MSGKTSRNKGRRGETVSKRLLQDRDYTILADTTAGLATDDLLAQDAGGALWSVEVKNQKIINPALFTEQARAQASKKHGLRWMVLAHIHNTSSWLVLKQGARPTIWHEKEDNNEGGK